MSRPVLLPGTRDARGRLDEAGGDAAVVACPPHPQHGGSRADPRLRAVSDALVERGIDCLRFDYGPWDEGVGERTDASAAVDWAADRYDAVGLFGYSFGAAIALATAAAPSSAPADAPPHDGVDALSALAPPASLGDDLDAVAALDRIECPVQIVAGERDDTVDWAPVAARAAELGHAVDRRAADHFFVGRYDEIARRVAAFLAPRLDA
ncbi:hypothetical protein SAMN06269185_3252 [Natronoarchaeum philippinense]|uniref:Dienelactone hydrolase domain-containing protein n=1 Tax=Natronoarchaeum philippinense TaxID=558529 RepID=A0A285P8N9_NATPI|nr:dienelactone hydrolase family protein [Natronoarchaeum philippinense]SNZ18119.1 hypothetical protein SAMN06269185_3252 [Natronoarchaeum philippinense]